MQELFLSPFAAIGFQTTEMVETLSKQGLSATEGFVNM